MRSIGQTIIFRFRDLRDNAITIAAVFCLIGIGSQQSNGQEPLLLQTHQQLYDRYTDTWNDESTITYTYDQTGRMINQTRKAPDPCKTDCPDYENTLFAKNVETWAFGDNGLETLHTEKNYRWQKTNNTPWVLQLQYEFKRSTSYNGDSLITDQTISNVYPAIEYQTGSSNTTTEHFEYNTDRQKILHTSLTENISQNYQSGRLNNTIYSYQNGLLWSETETRREFSKSDTNYYYNAKTTFAYNTSNKLLSSLYESNSNGSIYRSKSEYTYNANGQKTKEDSYYWDFSNSSWEFFSSIIYDYYPSGTRKQDKSTTLTNGIYYTVTTTLYDEAGKATTQTKDQYDETMVFVKQESKTYYEWVSDDDFRVTEVSEDGIWSYLQLTEETPEGKPLVYKFETIQLNPDSTFIQSSLYFDRYEYNNAGELIKRRETRVAYDADSLIQRGCCGFLYEAFSDYTNRCDGVPTTVVRNQLNYITGTQSEFHPEPIINRQQNTYTKTVCQTDETEPSALVVYPNPATTTVNIASDLLGQYNSHLNIVSSDGKLIRQMTPPITSSLAVDMTGMAPGLYILRLENESIHEEQKVVVLP